MPLGLLVAGYKVGTSRLISQVRAHRLADMRKRRGLTQREVAQARG